MPSDFHSRYTEQAALNGMVQMQGLLLEGLREVQSSSDAIYATHGHHPAHRHAQVCCALLQTGLASLNDLMGAQPHEARQVSAGRALPRSNIPPADETPEVAARMRVLELEAKVGDLENEMRTHDEDAEKMLVLLHEQLTLEQQTRKHLQDQLLREKQRTIEVGRHCSGAQRRQLGDGPMQDTRGSPSANNSSNLSGSFARLSHLDEAQGVETEELLAEISRLQVSRVSASALRLSTRRRARITSSAMASRAKG